ncbi:lipopolysaccharide core heptose(I) kinase RfaP [Coraliomargarita sp. W4R53]
MGKQPQNNLTEFSTLPMYLELDPQLKDALPDGSDPFEWFLHPQGTTHREVKHRLTYEMQLDGLHFFVKRHLGSGWKEVLKEWYRLRKPVVSARTEWEGAAILTAAGVRVPQILGKGERGRYPHNIESFVVLEAIPDAVCLEYVKAGWHEFTGRRWVALKRTLIQQIGSMVQSMHKQGINHRDLYINHFLINRTEIEAWQHGQPLPLCLIDLHRVQHRPSVPERWLLKDLRSLLFSAMDVGLTSADCGRFLQAYLGKDWKKQVRAEAIFWGKTVSRADKMYRNWHQRVPSLPSILSNQLK